MKLFGKKQWLLGIFGLISGLLLSGYVLKNQFGEINYWLLGLTGLVGLLMIVIISRFANK
jgi:hypothetical protein